MKPVLLAACASLAVAACESYPPGYYGSPAYGYDYAYAGGPAYYDDFYGPYYDGYWGGGGIYYYSPGAGRPFVRDEGHHFRRDPHEGFHGVHGRGGPHAHPGRPQQPH
jgi:hypothetical protein